MNKKIAVFLDAHAQTVSTSEIGIVKVYSKNNEEWKVIKEIIFGINDASGLKQIRENIRVMSEELGECRVFVAREVKGLLYTVLDGLGFNTWEIEGTPEEFLEYVLAREVKEEQFNTFEERKSEMIPEPVENGKSGYYFINLKKVQEDTGKISSKQVLLAFFNTTIFYELEIICSHIPPWFELELTKLNYEADIEHSGTNEVRITIHPKICSI